LQESRGSCAVSPEDRVTLIGDSVIGCAAADEGLPDGCESVFQPITESAARDTPRLDATGGLRPHNWCVSVPRVSTRISAMSAFRRGGCAKATVWHATVLTAVVHIRESRQFPYLPSCRYLRARSSTSSLPLRIPSIVGLIST